mmetsp:Transcript_12374/g.27497  ORF Transcript_12374/g.27497 Transcript_12374/m.27497 type:complete len:291 (+) Transcript_12374:58-930(+)
MADLIKKCNMYLARAKELDADQPIVAYYCRRYALDLLVKAKMAQQTTPDSDGLLMKTLKEAEEGSKNLDLSQGQDTMEAFALGLFDNADTTDRGGGLEGNSAKVVASQFYVAGLFLDTLAQFYEGELPPDIAEKARYAKFRAGTIRNAVSKGLEVPPPPQSQGTSVEQELEEAWAAAQAQAAAATAPSQTSQSPAMTASAPPPAAASPSLPPAPVAPAQGRAPPPAGGYPPQSAQRLSVASTVAAARYQSPKDEAMRKLEFAISAIDFDDVQSAVHFLREALSELDKEKR